MPEWYALTHLGAEPALVRELAFHGIAGEVREGGVAFTASKPDTAKVLYYLQCATRLLLAVDEGDFDTLQPEKAHAMIPEGSSFRVTAETLPTGPQLSSQELQEQLGKQVDRPVDLEAPEFVLYCQAAHHSLLGIDVAGDLSRRYYRIFTNSVSIKGTLAASIHWLFETEGSILDPFGNTGEIIIEAAFQRTNTAPLKYLKHQRIAILDENRRAWKDDPHPSEHPLWCFDAQLGNLRSCKKNAKLAGVDKYINFSKLDPEWMDVKFDEAQVENIVTIPPPVTNRNPEHNHIKELFYQGAFILGKRGKLVVGCLTPDTVAAVTRHAKDFKFHLAQEAVLYTGQLPVHVMSYEL